VEILERALAVEPLVQAMAQPRAGRAGQGGREQRRKEGVLKKEWGRATAVGKIV
jgi:hypothetical protein